MWIGLSLYIEELKKNKDERERERERELGDGERVIILKFGMWMSWLILILWLWMSHSLGWKIAIFSLFYINNQVLWNNNNNNNNNNKIIIIETVTWNQVEIVTSNYWCFLDCVKLFKTICGW